MLFYRLVYLFILLSFYCGSILYTNMSLFCRFSLYHFYDCFINLLWCYFLFSKTVIFTQLQVSSAVTGKLKQLLFFYNKNPSSLI